MLILWEAERRELLRGRGGEESFGSDNKRARFCEKREEGKFKEKAPTPPFLGGGEEVSAHLESCLRV